MWIMENINKLIAYLIAIANFSKDIHYSVKGDAFNGKHLLADRVYEGLNDFKDSVIEVCILGNDLEPLLMSEYNAMANGLTPLLSKDDREDFEKLKELMTDALGYLEAMQGTTRGENSLIDGIAQDLQGKLGLVNRQVK